MMESNVPQNPSKDFSQKTPIKSITTSNANLNSHSVSSELSMPSTKPNGQALNSFITKPASNQPIDHGVVKTASPSDSSSYIRPPEKPKLETKTEQQVQTKQVEDSKQKNAEPETKNSADKAPSEAAKSSAQSNRNTQDKKGKKSKKEQDQEQDQEYNQHTRTVLPGITERNNQSVSNVRNSTAFLNYNKNGSGTNRGVNGGKAKPVKPAMDIKRVNKMIDKAKQIQQLKQDLATAIKEGAAPKELKARASKLEKEFSSFTKELGRVSSKLDKLAPDSLNALKESIGADKFNNLSKAIDGVKESMSPESLKNIGMEGSKALNKAMPNFAKSTEKLQEAIQAMFNSISKTFSIGR